MNLSTSHIFYKTRMCYSFLQGNCVKGDSCTFAHGPTELREPPPNWPDLVNENIEQNLNLDKEIIHRMRLCHKFVNTGVCPYGERCSFLHESPAKYRAAQIERTRECSVIQIQTTVEVDRGQPSGGGNAIKVSTFSNDPNATFLKTRICTKWETMGKCPYGDKCHFAHGLAELHTPVPRMEGGDANAARTLHLPATELPPRETAGAVPLKRREGRGFAKLAGLSLNQIKGIYGDWIDEEEDEQDA